MSAGAHLVEGLTSWVVGVSNDREKLPYIPLRRSQILLQAVVEEACSTVDGVHFEAWFWQTMTACAICFLH